MHEIPILFKSIIECFEGRSVKHSDVMSPNKAFQYNNQMAHRKTVMRSSLNDTVIRSCNTTHYAASVLEKCCKNAKNPFALNQKGVNIHHKADNVCLVTQLRTHTFTQIVCDYHFLSK